MGITKDALDAAYNKYKSTLGGLREDYFALLYLAEEFDKPMDRVAHQVAFGNNDFGIDAFHFDREQQNLYLYQFKWSQNYQQFKESLRRLVDDGIERIFGNPHQLQDQNEVLINLKTCIHENQAIIDRVLVHFVFNGDPQQAEESQVLGNLREDLESKKHIIDARFPSRDLTLSFEFRSNESTKRRPQISKQTRRYAIDFAGWIKANGPTDRTALSLGLVPIMDLYSWYEDMGVRLLDRNLRMGLSGERPVNREIKKALDKVAKGQADPSEFVFNHNGVSIFAQRLEVDGDRATITEPKLLNGAQTITSLAAFIEQTKGNQLWADYVKRLGEVRVLAKVITSADDAFVREVTINNNRQNPVDAANLRANDRIQLELHDKFKEDLKIFYARQEDSFEALTDSDREDLGIEQQKAIEIKPLAQTFLAAQGEIDRMSRLTDVFENTQWYEGAFREGYLKTDARRIVLAYKIRFRLNRVLHEMMGSGDKYYYLGRARNLVWAMLIQGLLNEPKLDQIIDRFGDNLVAEADFTSKLNSLATQKIRPVFGEVFKEEKYREDVKAQKYSFLRTKATFQKCMAAATDRYGWKKMAL